VYCEDQLMDDLVGNTRDFSSTTYVPSALQDATKCKEDLKGETPTSSHIVQRPTVHRKRGLT